MHRNQEIKKMWRCFFLQSSEYYNSDNCKLLAHLDSRIISEVSKIRKPLLIKILSNHEAIRFSISDIDVRFEEEKVVME